MASAYLFHVVQNHPFLDGNKRVGTAAALTVPGTERGGD
jgi:death on curing protein